MKKINNIRKQKVWSFIYKVRTEGRYTDHMLDQLESHLLEGTIDSTVDMAFYDNPIHIVKDMMKLILEFSYHEFEAL